MKIAEIVIRTLMGLLFAFSSLAYFFNWMPEPEITGPLKVFNDGMMASGYLMTLVKSLELICAVLLLSGFFVPLAALLLSPILVNIFFVHVFLAPEGIPVAVALGLGNLFLGYRYLPVFKPIFQAKARH